MSLFLKKFLIFCALTATAAGQPLLTDSLIVSPPHPTTSDPVRLGIIINNWDCCTQYIHDSTAVTLLNDSTIMLYFAVPPQMNIQVCVDTLCGVTPVLDYIRGPLPAGNYSVYQEFRLCSDQTCPAEGLIAIQTLIGRFTVSQQAAVLFRQKPAAKENFGKMSGNVRVYDIRGALISSNLTGAPKHTSGVYFIKPDGRQAVKMEVRH